MHQLARRASLRKTPNLKVRQVANLYKTRLLGSLGCPLWTITIRTAVEVAASVPSASISAGLLPDSGEWAAGGICRSSSSEKQSRWGCVVAASEGGCSAAESL